VTRDVEVVQVNHDGLAREEKEVSAAGVSHGSGAKRIFFE
jgi:hypothetical protein